MCISLHSPERMTVNHDVTGSSPVGGAIKAVEFVSTAFFVCEFVNFFNKPWVIAVPETSVQGIIVFSITMKKILDTQKCILLTCKKHCDIILTGKNCIMFIHIIKNLHDRRFII